MRRKVNNSETHETKRYYEVPSEKVQEWSDTIENLTKQRDQFKTERDTLIDDLKTLRKLSEALKASENSLWLSSREFERERDELAAKVSRLERENRKLRVKSDSFFESWRFKSVMYTDLSKESDKYKSLLSEFSEHIGNKPSSSTYKYFRAKLDELGIKEGE